MPLALAFRFEALAWRSALSDLWWAEALQLSALLSCAASLLVSAATVFSSTAISHTNPAPLLVRCLLQVASEQTLLGLSHVIRPDPLACTAPLSNARPPQDAHPARHRPPPAGQSLQALQRAHRHRRRPSPSSSRHSLLPSPSPSAFPPLPSPTSPPLLLHPPTPSPLLPPPTPPPSGPPPPPLPPPSPSRLSPTASPPSSSFDGHQFSRKKAKHNLSQSPIQSSSAVSAFPHPSPHLLNARATRTPRGPRSSRADLRAAAEGLTPLLQATFEQRDAENAEKARILSTPLSPGQQSVVDAVMAYKSVFFTGCAGTGSFPLTALPLPSTLHPLRLTGGAVLCSMCVRQVVPAQLPEADAAAEDDLLHCVHRPGRRQR